MRIDLEASKQRNLERKNFIYFPSNLAPLRDHNGFRPEELHALIGEKGGGKSTLFRTWISECLYHGKKVYVRLSEERSRDYTDEIVENLGRVMDVSTLKSLHIDSELELTYDQHGNQYFEDLKLQLKSTGAEIFFLDNFTTSELSDCPVMLQGKNAKALRSLALELKIPVVVATHTTKNFKSSTIATGNDSRGSMTLVNTAAYVYSINVIFNHRDRPTVLFVDKARHHPDSNKALYQLTYEKRLGLFVDAKKISKSELAQTLKECM